MLLCLSVFAQMFASSVFHRSLYIIVTSFHHFHLHVLQHFVYDSSICSCTFLLLVFFYRIFIGVLNFKY